jgi:hypothetical protein
MSPGELNVQTEMAAHPAHPDRDVLACVRPRQLKSSLHRHRVGPGDGRRVNVTEAKRMGVMPGVVAPSDAAMGWYDAFARFYDTFLDRTYRAHRKAARVCLALEPGMTVVDVGCGTAQASPASSRPWARTVASSAPTHPPACCRRPLRVCAAMDGKTCRWWRSRGTMPASRVRWPRPAGCFSSSLCSADACQGEAQRGKSVGTAHGTQSTTNRAAAPCKPA